MAPPNYYVKHLSSSLTFLFLLLLTFSLTPPARAQQSTCNQDDKKALLAIFVQFGSPIPKSQLDVPCCDWDGISCDTNGRVIDFEVEDGYIVNRTTTIPAPIADLPYLQKLRLHLLHNLVGPIPSFITKLNRLTFLELSQNSLSGPIPSFLSQLTSLTYLKIDNNQFTGSIPPSLTALTNLQFLFLGGNKLSGSIPASFGNFADNISLDLSRNKLSGPIPATLGRPQWTTIDLSVNQFNGDASMLFGSSKTTSGIDISSNQFAFDLTAVRFPVNLNSLDISHNKIHGGIPAQVNDLTALVYTFDVSYNRLCGEIPAGNVTARFGQNSYLHNKCLCGAPLPACT